MAQEIAREHWIRFLDDFSRKYQGWHAGVEVEGVERPAIRNLPLIGITADEKDGENTVSIIVGDRPDDHDTHNIVNPRALRIDEEDRSTAGITIESESGETTHLRLTAAGPLRQSTVDDTSRDLGQPGGGSGRVDEVGRSGVYPVSAMEGASPEAQIQGEMAWGQGDRGPEGYYDHGDSEISTPEKARAKPQPPNKPE